MNLFLTIRRLYYHKNYIKVDTFLKKIHITHDIYSQLIYLFNHPHRHLPTNKSGKPNDVKVDKVSNYLLNHTTTLD